MPFEDKENQENPLNSDSSPEEEEAPPPEERYRDVDLERAQAAQKALEKQVRAAEAELASEKEREQELIAKIKGEKNVAKTKEELEHDKNNVKKILKRERSVSQINIQKRELKRRNDDLIESLLHAGRSFSKLAQKAVDKIVAYKMHAVRAPGDQAGIFDEHQKVSTKRQVKHDFSFGSEAIVSKIEAKVDGKDVSLTVTQRVDGNQQIGKTDVKVDKVEKSGYEVPKESLGNLTHDAIKATLERGQGINR